MLRSITNPLILKNNTFLWLLIFIICSFLHELSAQSYLFSVPTNSDVLLQKTDLSTGFTDILERNDGHISQIKGIEENSNTLYFVGRDQKYYKLKLTEGSIPEPAEVPDLVKYNSSTWSFNIDDSKFYYLYNGSIYRFYSHNSAVERISLPHIPYVFSLVKGHSRLIFATSMNNSLGVYMLDLQTLAVYQQFIIENVNSISSIIYDSSREHYYCSFANNITIVYDRNGIVVGNWSSTSSTFQNFQYDRISDRFYWNEGNNILGSTPLNFNPEIFVEFPHSYSKYYLPHLSKIVCISFSKRARVINVYLNDDKTDTLMYNTVGKISQIVSNESENCLYLVVKDEGTVLRYDLNTFEYYPVFSHPGIIESITHDKINNRIFVSSPISYSQGRLFEVDLSDLSYAEKLDNVPDLISINYEPKLNQIYGLTKYDSGFPYSHYILRINLNTGSIQHINGSGGGDSQGYLLDISNQYFYNLKFFGNEVIRMKYNLILGGTILHYPPERFNSIEWLDSSKTILALGGSGQLYSWNVETNAIDSLFKFDNQIEHFTVFRVKSNSTFDEQNSAISDCRAYPNPSHDFIYLDCNKETHSFQIIDVNGKIQTRSFHTENNPQIDISHLVPGFYFVRYFIENKVVNVPFVKS